MVYSNKLFGIFGLGISGAASVKFMLDRGYKFISWDDSTESIKNCGAKLKLSDTGLNVKHPDDPLWSSVDYVIASPGIPNLNSHKIIKNLKNDAEIICDIELFYRHFPKQKYIAITGTNGKSTTTKLIEHIFVCNEQKAVACGNIGVPILSVTPLEDDLIVLELSSYQLELIKFFKAHIAVILNVTPDHLDHHGSLEAYFDAKKRIFMNQTEEDYLILNLDDALLLSLYNSLAKEEGVRLVPISAKKMLSDGISLINNIIYDSLEKRKLPLPKNKNLRGLHNAENMVASYAATSISNELLKRNFINAIKTYPGLAHRLQFLGSENGIEFINDSKATNAESLEKALDSLKGSGDIFLIAGGLPKEGGIDSIKSALKHIKYVFLIGKAKEEFAKTLASIPVPSKLSNTLDIAFNDAMAIIGSMPKRAKKILLLSPACASFDQWKNFEKRGERFMELVQEKINHDINL